MYFFHNNTPLAFPDIISFVISYQQVLVAMKEAPMEFETSHEVKVVTSFDALKLKEDLLRGIYAYSMFQTLR